MLHCRFNVLFNLYLNLKFLISMSLLSDRYNCFRKALMIFHNHKKLRNRGCLSNISHSTTWKKENKFESKKKKNFFFFKKLFLWTISNFWSTVFNTKPATGIVLWKKVLLKISQNSQENTCIRVSFLITSQAWGNFIKVILAQVIFLWILRNF